jgi:hypothetical protein
MDAYMNGLEKRIEKGLPVDSIASVPLIFVLARSIPHRYLSYRNGLPAGAPQSRKGCETAW